ncbi:unnamed protein product [Rotaria sordida]|uniref:Uncharacterized protein n=1 Tax=Rotaria sordida TaxID=392033 RepID=A0A815BLQ0_9BILA|nr:unnamed protein product [Rotaria sordida]CAF1554360.1 unnamed protein product [Rotaria sordida]
MDDMIKSDDESRISFKCATLTCLSIDHCIAIIFQFLTDDNTYVRQLNNFEQILNDFRQSSIHDEIVYRLDIFSYLTILSEYF